jgi:hypothetical protein
MKSDKDEITLRNLETILVWANLKAHKKEWTENELDLVLKLNKWRKGFHKIKGKDLTYGDDTKAGGPFKKYFGRGKKKNKPKV